MNRIPESTIERILAGTEIVELVRSYIPEMKKVGGNYKCICPFHKDSNPSMTVSPAKQIYKCFSCGAGGNAINFVKSIENISYVEAIKKLAERIGEQVEEFELKGKDLEEHELKVACRKAMKDAALFYHKELKEEKNKEFLQYALKRMEQTTIDEELIGYANGGVYKHLKELGYSTETLNQAGLITISNDGSIRDKFYKRIIFPIRDVVGNVVAFTARSVNPEEKAAKYINSKEGVLYHKSQIIYGLDSAKKSIVKNDRVFLVEGNMDVLTLQAIGITNVIALSGTALSDAQINLLIKYTSNVYIIADTDEAGIKALNVNAQKLIQNKCTVYVVPLPDEEDEQGKKVKYDADSFFKGKDEDFFYNHVAVAPTTDYILWLCKQELEGKELAPAAITKKVKDIVNLISCYGKDEAATYINFLSEMGLKRNIWEKALNNVFKTREQQEKEVREKEQAKFEEEKKINPEQLIENDMFSRKAIANVLAPGVDKDFFLKYGFYAKGNELYFEVAKEQFRTKANFVITPIAHIMSDIESRRVFYILNKFNRENIIDLKQEEMISVTAFKKATESKGNYIFTGDLTVLDKLKEYLYEDTLTCREVNTLGWNKKSRFYCYGNGILKNNIFIPVDEFGIVKTKEENYFLPAYSRLNNESVDEYIDERTFSHKEREYKPTFREVSDILIELYGDHARVVLCAYIAVSFKDIIVRNNKNFPIINIFGVASSGKTSFCKNFMYFYGYGKEFSETKIDSTTFAALATYISKFSNCLFYLDEYKNNISTQKTDLLKSVWGSAGRKKSNLDNTAKTIQTKADGGLLMSGQELCTVDPALYTRTCTEKLFNTEFTTKETELFNQYEELAKDGLTHITNEILSHREYFEENFNEEYKKASEELKNAIPYDVNSRILQNWCILLASYKVMESKVDINLTYEEFLQLCKSRVIEQNGESKSISEIVTFWESVETNISNGKLKNFYDFEVQLLESVVVDGKEEIIFDRPTKVLFLNCSRVFSAYTAEVKTKGESYIPEKSMKSYLENSVGFLGHKRSKRFLFDVVEAGTFSKSSKINRSMVFEYDKLNVQLLDNQKITKGENDESFEEENLDETITPIQINNDLFTKDEEAF